MVCPLGGFMPVGTGGVLSLAMMSLLRCYDTIIRREYLP